MHIAAVLILASVLAVSPGGVITHGYDAVQRRDYDDVQNTRTETDARGNATLFSLDAMGRLIGVRDALNRLATKTYADGAQQTLGYDANGNRTEKTQNAATTNYRYGPRDRLLTLTLPNTPPILYDYDEQGLRIEQQSNGETTRYIYDGNHLIEESNTNAPIAHHKKDRHFVTFFYLTIGFLDRSWAKLGWPSMAGIAMGYGLAWARSPCLARACQLQLRSSCFLFTPPNRKPAKGCGDRKAIGPFNGRGIGQYRSRGLLFGGSPPIPLKGALGGQVT